MAKPRSKNQRKSAKDSKNRALNAFDTAVDDQYYIRGLRQQQDIDLDNFSDERIKQLLSNQVNSEDDEELDSDEAMGSASDISLGEPDSGNEDEWGESLDEAELLPLDEVWDLNNSDDEESTKKESKSSKSTPTEKASTINDNGISSDSDSDSDVESEDDSDGDNDDGSDSEGSLGLSDSESGSADDEESDDEEANEALRQAIRNVAGNTDGGFAGSKLVDTNAENPFALPGNSTEDSSSLSLEALAPGLKTAKTLSIPAPQRIQERANREVAYGLAKAEVEKWSDTVAANRRAEHLQFPINAPAPLQAASPFVPAEPKERNDLEAKVSQILRSSQLEDEKQASAFEETAAAKLSIEDLKKRRSQLRYMRDLMFREEQRAKRIKKIKSKTYRKIHKKERERMAELEQSENEDEDNESNLDKAERDRALERATLRHKNNSKWAKRMLEQGMTRDAGTRGDIEEMLRQSDALRQKIRGREENSDDETNINDLQDYAVGGDSGSEQEDSKGSKKGVLGMKFMQDAAKREREANDRLLRDDYESGDDETENLGRKTFTQAGQQLKRDIEAMREADDDEDRRDTSEKKKARKSRSEHVDRGDEVIEFRQVVPSGNKQEDRASKQKRSNPAASTDSNEPENPWLKASAANADTTNSSGSVKLASSKKDDTAQSKNPRSAKIVVENTFGDSLVREKDLTLQQQDLVRQAFAGDDVVTDFSAEKQAEVDEDKDQEIDETLPGWGSWSNEKPRIQKVRNVKGINEKQRRDYKKNDVILSEKINKKASKYNASAVPFPFENRQQYERSLRMPIGQEWVTKDTFQRQTKPRVIVKRGSIIDPIKKPRSNH